MKKQIKIPKFKNEDQERDYWSKLDLSKHFQPENFENVHFPNLKPTTQPISIRIPSSLLVAIKEKANSLNIPYQSLIKTFLAEKMSYN